MRCIDSAALPMARAESAPSGSVVAIFSPAGDRRHLITMELRGVPTRLHSDDHRWILRPDPSIQLWNGETLKLLPDVTLIRCGGHFPGGTVLHWAQGAGGLGVLCSSDIATVTTDRKFLSFMRS